ncbi:helix-turn-helix transcriptional regulator [Paucilactobacillus sp. N302-9]
MNNDKVFNAANKIKELRKEQNKTQKDVALAIGMTEQAVANYETGKREPKLKTWRKLANFFGVQVGYLIGGTENVGN